MKMERLLSAMDGDFARATAAAARTIRAWDGKVTGPTTIFIRQPNRDQAELVIGHGDHACTVLPLTLADLARLNEQCAHAIRGWPVSTL